MISSARVTYITSPGLETYPGFVPLMERVTNAAWIELTPTDAPPRTDHARQDLAASLRCSGAAIARRTRQEQGLPERVTDGNLLRAVSAILFSDQPDWVETVLRPSP